MDRVTEFKEAIKVGLAMTVAYYVALRFEWMSPTWPAITVAVISTPTAGQSITKGLLRIGGTLMAFVAGLFFLGLFPQDRWYFFLAFTPFLAFVTYKMTGKDGQYFWFCAGFVSLMITTAGPQDGSAFLFAAYRTMETIFGVLIWTAISVFIWPRSNRQTLVAVSHNLCDSLAELVRGYRDALLDGTISEKLKDIRAQAGKLTNQLEQTITAAASESYEVREVRHHWVRLHTLSVAMLEILDRLQLGLQDLRPVNFESVAGDLEDLFSLLDSRLRDAGGMLKGNSPGEIQPTHPYSSGGADIKTSNHFQRAAVEVARIGLSRLDSLTLSLAACVGGIQGHERLAADADTQGTATAPSSPFDLPTLDPDRVRATIMVVASLWSAALIWIYINPPGHTGWYMLVPTFSLILAQTPFVQFRLFKPFAYAFTAALTVYVSIMPLLSSFWGLGTLIFGMTFIAAFFFTGLGRVAIYISMFAMLGISNHQTYNFAAQVNTLVFILSGILLVVVLSYITRSPRPEKAFLDMLGRFFRSCEFCVSRISALPEPKSLWERLRMAFHLQEIRSLPTKLNLWGSRIDRKKFPHNSPGIGDGRL